MIADRAPEQTEIHEDLRALAGRAYRLALRHCGTCMNYHIYWPARRAAGIVGGSDEDRRDMVKAIAGLASSGRSEKDLNILIAGAADTGVLATAANGVIMAGSRQALDRVKFTVVDQCETPLELCREFGEQNRLNVSSSRCDLFEYEPENRFDLIVSHSTIAFFPENSRAGMLRTFARWLKPDGHIVLSVHTGRRNPVRREARFEQQVLPKLQGAVDSGLLDLPEGAAAFLDRCRNRNAGISYDHDAFADGAAFRDLLDASGLTVVSVQTAIRGPRPGTPRSHTGGLRAIAVIGR